MAEKKNNDSLDISQKLENWLIWQNQIQPFLFKDDFYREMANLLASGSLPLKFQAAKKAIENSSLSPIDKLQKSVMNCNGCRLWKHRKNVVFGEGDLNADIMFIGEGPGENEDLSGRPFVGKAGQLLTKIIENGMKIPRSSVYIANVVKCRPPGNRDPLPDEAESCIGFLKNQIKIVNPKVLILLGKVVAKYLIGVETSISKARENVYLYGSARAFVTYHPSALLRNESYKKLLWEDMKKVLAYLNL